MLNNLDIQHSNLSEVLGETNPAMKYAEHETFGLVMYAKKGVCSAANSVQVVSSVFIL